MSIEGRWNEVRRTVVGPVAEIKIETIPFSVRVNNVLSFNKIHTLGDLSEISPQQLMRFPNFGKTSLRELVKCVENLLEKLPQQAPDQENSANGAVTLPAESAPQTEPPQPCLLKLTLEALSTLTSREREVIGSRLGTFGMRRQTLDEIGTRKGVTRERIRQIEAKARGKVARYRGLADMIESAVDACRQLHPMPISLLDLAVSDHPSAVLSTNPRLLDYLLGLSQDPHFHLIEIDNIKHLSPVAQPTWNAMVNSARGVLGDQAHIGQPVTTLRSKFLQDQQESDVAEVAWATALLDAHIVADDSEQETLVAFGTAAPSRVKLILESNDKPMHIGEIIADFDKRFGKCRSHGSIRNAAGQVGVLLGSGTYGLKSHISIPESSWAELIEYCEGLVEAGPVGRQWTASEFLHALRADGIIEDSVNHYEVNAVLEASDELEYLGRFAWVGKVGETANRARLEYRDLVAEILEEAGRPMSYRDLKERIAEVRGMHSTFQIHDDGRFVRVDRGVWGLRHRDLPVTQSQIADIQGLVRARLNSAAMGLHQEALFMDMEALGQLPDGLNCYSFAAVVTLAGDLRLSRAGYLYLDGWGGDRIDEVDIVQ